METNAGSTHGLRRVSLKELLACKGTAPEPSTALSVTVYSAYESDAPARSPSLKKVNSRVFGKKVKAELAIESLTSTE